MKRAFLAALVLSACGGDWTPAPECFATDANTKCSAIGPAGTWWALPVPGKVCAGTEFLADEWRMEIGTADAFGATGTAESPKAGERPLQCFWSRRDPIVDYMPRKGWIENGGQR